MSNLSSIKVKPLQPVKDQPPLVYRSLPGDAGNPLPKKAKLFPGQKPLPAADEIYKRQVSNFKNRVAALREASLKERGIRITDHGVQQEGQQQLPEHVTTTAKTAKEGTTKRMGRPATGMHPVMGLRINAKLQSAIRALAKERGLSVVELVTTLFENAVAGKKTLPSPLPSEKILEEKIRRAVRRIAREPVTTQP